VHCANVVVRGSWLHLRDRKVVVPPQPIVLACQALPRSADFEILESGKR
jgi:hypothetical protein